MLESDVGNVKICITPKDTDLVWVKNYAKFQIRRTTIISRFKRRFGRWIDLPRRFPTLAESELETAETIQVHNVCFRDKPLEVLA